MTQKILIDGPDFEDFSVGQTLPSAPSITVTSGYAAQHQALFADRMRLPLDQHLTQQITGSSNALVNPGLVCNLAIGQSTYASQKVKGNLFYRGLVFRQPVYIGDTLTTTTNVVALKQNKIKEGRAATGMVVLEMTVTNQHNETVLHFWRCPMIPCRDPNADTGKNDSFDAIPDQIDLASLQSSIPESWDLGRFNQQITGEHFEDIQEGAEYRVVSKDTITSAPELVRFTLNMAKTHTDASSSAYNKRLVYGGHTISMAAAQITRAFPNLVNVLAWRSCDHVAPVFEQDILQTEIKVVAKQPLKTGGLLDLHVEVFAERGPEAPKHDTHVKVLDWKVIALMS